MNRKQVIVIHKNSLIYLLSIVLVILTGCSNPQMSSQNTHSDFALASGNQYSTSDQIYQPLHALENSVPANNKIDLTKSVTEANPSKSPVFQSSSTPEVPATTNGSSHPEEHDESNQELEPLHFTFPTQVAESSTLWRPPLYPVPWEPTPNDHFYFIRPIGANEINWPLANYRYGGVFFEGVVHTGIDIPAPKGTPVMAAGSGKVVWAGYGLYFLKEEYRDPYGLAVAIKHDFGYQGNDLYTIYGHLDEIFTYQGELLQAGDLIGKVGETGKVTGPHLHFEVRLDKNNYFGTRNPELWIAPPEGWGIIAAKVMDRHGDQLERYTVMLRNIETNRYWTVLTYGKGSVNQDPYYRENMVIGDLPAGKYVVWIKYGGSIYDEIIEVFPGKVSFFEFIGSKGFDTTPPKDLTRDFVPPDTLQIPLP